HATRSATAHGCRRRSSRSGRGTSRSAAWKALPTASSDAHRPPGPARPGTSSDATHPPATYVPEPALIGRGTRKDTDGGRPSSTSAHHSASSRSSTGFSTAPPTRTARPVPPGSGSGTPDRPTAASTCAGGGSVMSPIFAAQRRCSSETGEEDEGEQVKTADVQARPVKKAVTSAASSRGERSAA